MFEHVSSSLMQRAMRPSVTYGSHILMETLRQMRKASDGMSIGLVSEPAELFCAYGIQARAHSPFDTTLVLGLANGMIGYVPTPNVYTEGGYECEATQVAPGAGEQLCQTMIETLHAVA